MIKQISQIPQAQAFAELGFRTQAFSMKNGSYIECRTGTDQYSPDTVNYSNVTIASQEELAQAFYGQKSFLKIPKKLKKQYFKIETQSFFYNTKTFASSIDFVCCDDIKVVHEKIIRMPVMYKANNVNGTKAAVNSNIATRVSETAPEQMDELMIEELQELKDKLTPEEEALLFGTDEILKELQEKI
jgi:hypothetical protein